MRHIVDAEAIAVGFVLDAARMVITDVAVGADPTVSMETLRRALAQLDRAETVSMETLRRALAQLDRADGN